MLWVLSYILSYSFILLGQTLILWLIHMGRPSYEQSWFSRGLVISAFVEVPLIAIPVSLVVLMYLNKRNSKKIKKNYKGVDSIVIMLTVGLLLVGLLFFLLYPSIAQSGILP